MNQGSGHIRTSVIRDANKHEDSRINQNSNTTQTQSYLSMPTGHRQIKQDEENIEDSADEEEKLHNRQNEQETRVKAISDKQDSSFYEMFQHQNNSNFQDDSKHYKMQQIQNQEDIPDDGDVGMQYIQFIYNENVKLQQEISECTDQMIKIDQQHIKER